MNAEGLLRKQGWRGSGFSLDTSDRGIKKPLLISHKQDQLGLGKKKASHTTDDQWWMRAFDESLQNLGTGQTSTLTQIQEKGINRGGLYGFFVKGEGLKGSIGDESSAPTSGTTTPPTSAEDEETDESDSDSNSTSNDDAASDSSKIAKLNRGQNKRKREAENDAPATKKLKQETGAVKVNARAVANAEGEVRTAFGSISADEWPKVCAVASRIEKQVKAWVKKNEKAGEYGDRTNIEDPKNPGTKLGRKIAKVEYQKTIRAAKKQMVKKQVVEVIVKGELPMLNPENLSKADVLKNYGKIEKAIKAVENANKLSSKIARQTKREQRKQAKAERARSNVREKTKEIHQPTVEMHLAQLSSEKQVEYAAHAAEKGQTLEEYTRRRIEKKNAKRAEKTPDKKDEKTALVEIKDESDGIVSRKDQKKAQRRLEKEKEKSAKPAGKVKLKSKISQGAKAKNKGRNHEAARGTRDEELFQEKAARFGAVATPITASA